MNKCLWCGKEVKNKFCNVSCQNRFQKRKPSIEQIKKGQITRFGEFKIFNVLCNKCGKEFQITEREKLHPQKEKYYCSRGCANSREHSEETKLKTSNSIKKLILDGNAPGFLKTLKIDKNNIKLDIKNRIRNNIKDINKICEYCKKEFLTSKKLQKCCSISCSSKLRGGWKTVHKKLSKDDWSRIHKKSYENGTNHVAGGTTKWLNYKDIKVQGTYELRTCYILDKWKEQNFIKDWEYTNDKYDYIGIDNKKHMYLIDFKIFNNDGTFYYLETKGWKKENDERKWESVRNKGYRLDVWFKQDIINYEK